MNTLVQAVKKIGRAGPVLREQPAMTSGRKVGGKGAEVAMGPVAKQEAGFGMGAGETVEYLS
jgi:hypothetical protein